MIQKPDVDITAKLYSIAEQLKAIGNEGLQHYVNDQNKIQHEKLVNLGSRLYKILDTVSSPQSGKSEEIIISSSNFSNELSTIVQDLKKIEMAKWS